jgi:hypothetical protein
MNKVILSRDLYSRIDKINLKNKFLVDIDKKVKYLMYNKCENIT